MKTIKKDGTIIEEHAPLQINYASGVCSSQELDHYEHYNHYNLQQSINSSIVKMKPNYWELPDNEKQYVDPAMLQVTLRQMEETILKLTQQLQQTNRTVDESIMTFNTNFGRVHDGLDDLGKTQKISYIHNCASCGHPLEIEENHPIFYCKYCSAAYIIGPHQIHSVF